MRKLSDKNQKNTTRDSRFELLRILAILLIIGSHVAEHGNGNSWNMWRQPLSGSTLVSIVLGSWGQLGVMTFVFISSWFLCDSGHFHFRKAVGIIVQTFEICVLLMLAVHITGVGVLSADIIQTELLGAFSTQYWFIYSYLVFYFIVPLLKKAVSGAEEDKLGHFLLLMTLMLPVYKFFTADTTITGSLGDFCYMFTVAAYLKRKNNNFIERHAVSGFMSCAALVSFMMILLNLLGVKTGNTMYYALMGQVIGRGPIIMYMTVCLFYIFKDFSSIRYSKGVNEIAGTVFGIYLIHENLLLRGNGADAASLLWDRALKMNIWFNRPWYLFLLYWILCVAGIFLVCMAAEKIRMFVFDRLLLDRISFVKKGCARFDRWYLQDDK